MDAGAILASLGTVRALDVLDDDVRCFFAGIIADGEVTKSAHLVREALGPFLDSAGVAETAPDIARVCDEIIAALVASKLIKPPKAKSKDVSASKALKQALAGAGKGGLTPITEAGATSGGADEDGSDEEDDDDSDDDAADETAARARKGGRLAGPVKLGAKGGGDSTALDILWGKDTNSFLNQNTVFQSSSRTEAKAAKRAARDAKKEEDRLRYQRGKAAEAAAAEAATDAEAGRVSSGTVTYTITEERKAGQDVHVSGFNMGYGGENLLEGADLRIVAGRRYGLVGRNGMGKSTLLRHMSRGDIAGAGAQRFPRNLRVLHVEQEVAGDGATVLETVMNADVERRLLLAEEAEILASMAAPAAAGDAAAAAGSGASTATATDAGSVAASAAGADDAVTVAAASSAASSASSASSATAATASGAGGVGGPSAAASSASSSTLQQEAAHARLRDIAMRLEALDAASAESRASALLAGLGFTAEMHAWPTRALSGGWRMRVALCCALFVEPDILCLDEPTNHIDARSILWLTNYLLTYPHTLMIVSHDRWFLNQVCTDVVHLFGKKLDYYKGDYDTFERTRAEKRRHLEKATEGAEMKRKHVQSFIDKFRYNAKRASLVQSRIKALERMEVLEEVADDPKWHFEFPDPGPLGVPVLQIDDVSFGYTADRPLFRGVNFSVDTESRIAIVGPNGVGKSTLLKLILGELEAQAGAVNRNPKLRIACFTQHHVNQLDLTANPVDFLLRLFPGAKLDAARAHLGSFGISGDLALQTMRTLSGGQKSRVAFAVLTWKKPHVLVLDEPSNNLDIETIDAVVVALGNFTGGVIVVSHDQHFVESVCDEIYVIGQPAGRVSKFKGSFAAYRKVAETEKAYKVGGGLGAGSGSGGATLSSGGGGGGDVSPDDE